MNSSDTTIAFGGLEADGHLSDLLHSSQTNLTVITREINSLQQRVEARESQPTEELECIEWELWNFSLVLRVQPISTSNTFQTIWRSHTSIQRHIMHHTEPNKSHKITATGHCHFQ